MPDRGLRRQQFYEIRRNFHTYGADGLLDKISGARPPHPNRVLAEAERAILDDALAPPCRGALRVANELDAFSPQECANYLRNAGYPSA